MLESFSDVRFRTILCVAVFLWVALAVVWIISSPESRSVAPLESQIEKAPPGNNGVDSGRPDFEVSRPFEVITPESRRNSQPLPNELDSPKKPTSVSSLNVGDFVIQVGAFTKEASAVQLQQELQRRGYKAFIQTPTLPEQVFRLAVGPFGSKEEASTGCEALRQEGIESFVRRIK